MHTQAAPHAGTPAAAALQPSSQAHADTGTPVRALPVLLSAAQPAIIPDPSSSAHGTGGVFTVNSLQRPT